MHDVISCPNCRKRLQLAAQHVGKDVQCPACAARFVAQPYMTPAEAAPDANGDLEQGVTAFVIPAAPTERGHAPTTTADDDKEVAAMWRRLLPAWIGLAIGGFFCVLFIVLGPGQHRFPEMRTQFHVETVDGRGGAVHYWTVPLLMPVMGFFLGLLVFLYRKATDRE
jgi:hypothetical protein